MKLRIAQWILGLAAFFMVGGIATPSQAAAETRVVVSFGHVHHRHYYRGHYVEYYRHGRLYRVYRYY